MADSPHDHEREALAFLRRKLPDRAPYHVWSNFEFVAPGGNLYEVDALAVTDNGLYLIEVKSYPGEIGGDASTWQWVRPDGSRGRPFDNPRLLANRKAKALKEVLSRTRAFAKRRSDLPYVTEVVFLSDPHLRVTLSPPGRENVFGRDAERGEELPPERARIGGIVSFLTSLDPDGSGRPRRRVDTPLGARIVKAVEEAGIRERASRRQVGDYQVGALLEDVAADRDTGVAYQDFLAERVDIDGLRRRLRVYPLEQNATTEQRQAASRAAKREYTYLDRLRHPGIAAPREFVEHDRGPCLLFDHEPDEQPLDRWLGRSDVRDQLDIGARLDVVRSIAEAMAYAHARGIYHRTLSPSAVWVAQPEDDPRPAARRSLRVANWHAGARVGTGDASMSMTGTAHVDALSGGDAALYRAPEHALEQADPARLDVFSLGCLTAFLFTEAPPAPTPGRLRDQLATVGHVAVEATGDGVDTYVATFVAELTDGDPARRPPDAEAVLAKLDELEAALTEPDPIDEPHVTMARRGASLDDGRFAVLGRIGLGSTAFALLVEDTAHNGRVCVLKVARTPQLNDRVRSEGAALDGLRHPGIVELLDPPLDLDGHTALILSFAGDRGDTQKGVDGDARAPRTLAARIGEPIGAELLQRWGEDLLDAVRYLEQMGVSHRDIKPENLGLAPRGRGDQLHLVLFDFSLAGTPVDRVEAGTPGYVDPFLRARGRWDPAAERYSAAVVLHEMATGTKPTYGDGRADPALVDAEFQVEAELFEAGTAEGLSAFFTRALAREAGDRHDTADDMVWAWRAAFRDDDRPGPRVTPDEPFTVPAGTTASTPLVGLPLSQRALNALEREDILTVAGLLGTPLIRLRQLRGVGNLTRRELSGAVAALREAVEVSADPAAPVELSLPAAAGLLTPRPTADNERQGALVRRYLGLDGEGGEGEGEAWPTQADLARAGNVSRQRVGQVLKAGRGRWLKQPAVTTVRSWLADELAAANGLASLAQLTERLAQARPTPATSPSPTPATSSSPSDVDSTPDGIADAGQALDDRRAARALLRAALVVEAERTNPRFTHRVLDPLTVVAALDVPDGPGANALADYASALVEPTRRLLASQAIVPRHQVVGALREVDVPAGVTPLPDAPLVELAASLTTGAAVNNRLELYRQGLAAADAVAAARSALVTLDELTIDDLAGRVTARFPDAGPLPARPLLDELVTDTGLDLRWDEDTARYRTPQAEPADSTSPSLSRHSTANPTISVTPVEIDVAGDFEERLARSLDAGGLLVLVTDAKYVERAADELAGRFPVTTVDVDDWLIAEVERITASGRPSWDLVVDADAAGPGSAPWHNLRRLVDRAADALTERLAATTGTVLLTRLGLLARYDRLDLVAAWRERLHDPSTALDALWMLVSSRAASDVPILDGCAVPVLTAGEWARIPADWLRNAHRTTLAPGAPR